MTVRRTLPHLTAALLGIACALLVACGGGTTRGIPAASAGVLKEDIEDVEQAVDSSRCDDVPGQLRQVDERLDTLPASTDAQLMRNLRAGADRLREVAVEECGEQAETETTPTTTETVEQTDTEPEPTTPPPPPPPTATVPPAATTTTPAPTTTNPAPQPPAPGTPGGGTPPEVP